MKTWIKGALAPVMGLGLAVALLAPTPAKAETTLMSYEIDLVSDYVVRGADVFERSWAFHKKDVGAFDVSPALQPSVTFFGPSGFSVNVWTSFALTDRDDDLKKNFTGLSELDESDYTLAYDWSNKMGAFTAGAVWCEAWAKQGKARTGFTPANPASDVNCAFQFLKWSLPVAKSVSPFIKFTQDTGAGNSYFTGGISGGEKLTWSAVLDEYPVYGVRDVTGTIGYGISDSFAISLSLAYRPHPEVTSSAVGANKDGDYSDFNGDKKTVPSTIGWLTIAYTGSVTDK